MKASVRPRLDPKGADSSALLYWALLIPIDNLGGKWKMVTWVLCHSLPPTPKTDEEGLLLQGFTKNTVENPG